MRLGLCRDVFKLDGMVLSFKVITIADIIGQLSEGLRMQIFRLDSSHVSGVT